MTAETMTPNFETFLYRAADGPWQPSPGRGDGLESQWTAFEWNLRAGPNRLEVKTVNRFGREGRASRVEVEKKPVDGGGESNP